MTDRRALPTMALAMLLLASVMAWAHAQEKDNEPAPELPAKSASAPRPDRPLPATGAAGAKGVAAAQGAQGLGAFGQVLPQGVPNKDVRIPSFKDGVPSSTLRADTMTRVDDENMEMERMVIRLYGASHDDDVNIRLETALYHMPSQILSSDTRSRISRSDFELEGDSMIFDTRTGQGTMTGRVRMVLKDSDSFNPNSKDKPAAASDKAADEKPAVTPETPAAAPTPTPPTSPPTNEKK